MAATIAQMTPAELREMIEEVVDQKLAEYLGDPDEGLELRPEFVEQLKRQRAAVAAGERGRPLAGVLAELRSR